LLTRERERERESSSEVDVPDLEFGNYIILPMSIYHQHPEVRLQFIEMHNDLNDFYYELIEEAMDNGEIRDDYDIRTLVILIQSCLRGHLDLWMNQLEFSFEELVESNLKMIWEAIKK